MEYLDKIKESYPLPVGYTWEYWYQKSYSNPYDGWDHLRVVDKFGHTVQDNIIHGVRDYYRWIRSAETTLADVGNKLANERFRQEMMNPTSKLEDVGESKTYEDISEGLNTILSNVTDNPKKKGWWR